MITIKQFKKEKLNDALSLLEKSDNTNRSLETWYGNDMTAVIAYDEGRPIGIIPFEKIILHL